MPPRDLVDYAYIAQQLGVLTDTVRHMAVDARKGRRHPLFPSPVNPDSRSPLFEKTAADTFIRDRLDTRLDIPGQPRTREETHHSTPITADTSDLINRTEAARILGLSPATITMLRSPADSHYDPEFPEPITPRRHRTPLWQRKDIDAYAETRSPRRLPQ